MKYHIYIPFIDEMENNLPTEEFYKNFYDSSSQNEYFSKEKKENLTLQHIINSEFAWVKKDRPCYKVASESIEHFAKTPLNIPLKDFRMPYESFLVRFPKENGIEVMADGNIREVKTALFFISQGFLGIVYHVSGSEIPFCLYAKMQNENQTIEQVFHSVVNKGIVDETNETLVTSETTSFIISVCVGVSIFATNIQFKAEYNSLEFLAEKCKCQKQQRILKMAKKKEHIGTITLSQRDLNIFNETVKSKTIGIGKELTYKHIRAAYTRKQRYGVGRQFIKTVEIKQTVVRPDLPARQYQNCLLQTA